MIAIRHSVIAVLVSCVLGPGSLHAGDEDVRPQILAHYLPWYASKPLSGAWGWHWTMNRFDPDVIRENGELVAATHDQPLIGLYDSGDPDTLECQVLLMKFSGIDGVIIDWYGTDDFNDYAAVHRNTLQLIPFLKKAGLRFAICYEDQSAGQQVEHGAVNPEQATAAGKRALDWLDENWFPDPAYVKLDDRPVLFVFGPQYFEKSQWEEMRLGLSSKPIFFSLPHLSERMGGEGIFGWPPVSGGKTVPPADWRKVLEGWQARSSEGESVIPVVFPGFHDIYEEAGLHDSYGFIDARDGKTFDETWELAVKSQSPLIQIATWNDYGEGTVIEPTRKLGYRYLEKIQEKTQAERDDTKRFETRDLRLPVVLFQLRKSFSGNAELIAELNGASDLLFAGLCDQARAILEQLQATLSEP